MKLRYLCMQADFEQLSHAIYLQKRDFGHGSGSFLLLDAFLNQLRDALWNQGLPWLTYKSISVQTVQNLAPTFASEPTRSTEPASLASMDCPASLASSLASNVTDQHRGAAGGNSSKPCTTWGPYLGPTWALPGPYLSYLVPNTSSGSLPSAPARPTPCPKKVKDPRIGIWKTVFQKGPKKRSSSMLITC